jgi:Lhr-like helicase
MQYIRNFKLERISFLSFLVLEAYQPYSYSYLLLCYLLHCRHFLERQLDVGVESLHGDKDQAERTMSMKKFSKSEETAILVATDIASRGLDVKDIRTVINYDVAKNIETYVHRIGRTGQQLNQYIKFMNYIEGNVMI